MGELFALIIGIASAIDLITAFIREITIPAIRNFIQKKKAKAVKAIVKSVLSRANRVKLDTLDEYDNAVGKVEIEGETISPDVVEGAVIYI